MTVYATPGSTFNSLAKFASGLAGTIGVRVIDADDGNTVVARFTAGISEVGTSGLYRVTLTAPAGVDDYVIQWDDGAGVWANEELFVNATGTSYAPTTAANLCTVADVRIVLQSSTGDTGSDNEITDLIPKASAAIQTWTCREFAPAQNGLVRRLSWRGGTLLLEPYDLRAVSQVRLDPDATAPQTLAVGTGGYVSGLIDRYGVYRRLRLDPTLWSCGKVFGDDERTVEVTGDWGFPAIPDDVRQAAAVTVASWLNRSTADYANLADTGTFDTTPDLSPNYAIPTAARQLLRPFRRLAVA